MRLIALHGKAGAGKDTFADRLVEKHGFVKRGFADPLYEEVAAAFETTVERLRERDGKETMQDYLRLALCREPAFVDLTLASHEKELYTWNSPRYVLQKWGTEYRRGQNDRYWLEHMEGFIDLYRGVHDGVVIPDCRFENEARWVKANSGEILEIRRTNIPPVVAHASEMGIPSYLIDDVIYNDWVIAGLHELADRVVGCSEEVAA